MADLAEGIVWHTTHGPVPLEELTAEQLRAAVTRLMAELSASRQTRRDVARMRHG